MTASVAEALKADSQLPAQFQSLSGAFFNVRKGPKVRIGLGLAWNSNLFASA